MWPRQHVICSVHAALSTSSPKNGFDHEVHPIVTQTSDVMGLTWLQNMHIHSPLSSRAVFSAGQGAAQRLTMGRLMAALLFTFGDGALSFGCITIFGIAFPLALADTCDCVGGMHGGGGMLEAFAAAAIPAAHCFGLSNLPYMACVGRCSSEYVFGGLKICCTL